ncbi:MAG TPA: hypothetical protein VFR94_06090 [Nitrososphaeraceae archaeon]|nr:hypothetical protein [Nitrososphaeraceae archaeon]
MVSRRTRRKKPLIAWRCSSSSTCNRATVLITTTTIMIIALTTLLAGSGFVFIISPMLMTAALAQEGTTTISTTGAAAATTSNTTTQASPAPGIESSSSQPNLNISEIPVSEVNGTYMNPNIGFQINLPTGWNGIEINFLVSSVFAVPRETDLLASLVFQEPSTSMTIVGIDQESFNRLESVDSQLPALGGGGASGGEQAGGTSLPQGSSSSSDTLGTTTTTPFGDSAVSCTYLQPSFVTINGINAEERAAECVDEEAGGVGVGTNALKTKSYTFATQDNSLIVLGFFGNSTITYDQNLPLFEESVRTISISQPADIATSEIYQRYKQLVEMQQQQLSNQTSSEEST